MVRMKSRTDPAAPEPTPSAPAFGVYVHYPYCARHCPYCDFNVAVARQIPHADYRDAVLAELAARAPDFDGRRPAISLYFGGGTPGMWPAAHIGAVIDAVDARFGLASEAEITVECNPEDVDRATMTALRARGVNRISLGVQSFDDALLTFLGRLHTGDDARHAVDTVRAAGIEGLSIDLMHGAADQTMDGLLADVEAACALAPPHVSTYQLTVEPRTAFGARAARGESLLVDEERLLTMYRAVRSTLAAHGIEPYEISNAARPGREAVHNNLYWTGGEYLALGAGAHGFRRVGDGAERWQNTRHPKRYMRSALAGSPGDEGRETLDAEEVLEDRVMCGLRLDRGLTVDDVLRQRFGAAARRLAGAGLLEGLPTRWRATERGRVILDRVVLELIAGRPPTDVDG